MPWTLIRSILKESTLTFLVAFVGLTTLFSVILLMQLLQRYEVIALDTMLAFVPEFAVGYQATLIPLATLVALTMAYGRMSAEGESTALYASGVSPRRLLAPAVVVSLLLVIPCSYSAWVSGPQTYGRRDELRTVAVSDALRSLPSGQQSFGLPGVTIAYEDVRDNIFTKLVLRQVDAEGERVLTCNEAELRYDRATSTISLFGGTQARYYSYDRDGRLNGPSGAANIRKLSFPLELAENKHVSAKEVGPRGLWEMVEREMAAEEKSRSRGSFAEFMRRLVQGMAPLFIGLLGALVGLWSRSKNRVVPLSIALMFGATTLFGGQVLALGVFKTAELSRWLSALLGLAVAYGPITAIMGVLWWRARRG